MNAPQTTMTGETALMIRRSFDADIQTLWGALTDPAAWMQWFGGGAAKPYNTNADLRRGGRWAIEMKGLETGKDISVGGEFLEVDEPNRVSFTWAWYTAPEVVSVVTYALSDAGNNQTTLTLTHEKHPSSDARDHHGRGWNATLDRLVTFLAK